MNVLSKHLSKFSSAPFLFVGSGFSRRYLGLPDWEGLLRLFCASLPRQYEYYFGSANGDMPRTARLIAEDFHNVWWESDKFLESRSQFASEIIEKSSALKIEISQYLLKNQNQFKKERLSELQLLPKAQIDGIVTTNWDISLEKLFPEYKVFVGQNELLFSTVQNIGEIYKIHGSAISPNSLILTDEDYTEYNHRNPYLSAKLLTIFVEHPTIFLGYSLSDPNIKEILGLIASTLTNKNIEKLRDRLIIVTWQEGLTKPVLNHTSIVIGDYIIPVVHLEVGSFRSVFSALLEFKRKFSVRVLRQLKEHVYSLVLENDPRNQLYVQDIESETHILDADLVLGVGARTLLADFGYKRIDRYTLIEDLLSNGNKLAADKILYDLLPELLASTHFMPIFKYMFDARLDCDKAETIEPALPERVLDCLKLNSQEDQYQPHLTKVQDAIKNSCTSIKELIAKTDLDSFIVLLPHVSFNEEEAALVRDRLTESFHHVTAGSRTVPTTMAKAACYFDFMLYRKLRQDKKP